LTDNGWTARIVAERIQRKRLARTKDSVDFSYGSGVSTRVNSV